MILLVGLNFSVDLGFVKESMPRLSSVFVGVVKIIVLLVANFYDGVNGNRSLDDSVANLVVLVVNLSSPANLDGDFCPVWLL